MDLVRIDRDIAAAAADVATTAKARRAGDDASVDWEAHRHVAGKRALGDLERLTDPARDALADWITWLTVMRVSDAAEVRLAALRAKTRVTVHLEIVTQLNARELMLGMLGARSASEARSYFAPWPELALALRGEEGALREMRKEAFHRLGIGDVPQRFLGISHADVTTAARQFLAATTELANESLEREPRWPLDTGARLAREATEGWPSRLTWRTVTALLPGWDMRNAKLPPPPMAYGAASFVRALESMGVAFRRAASPASLPFAVREPPLFVDAHRTGFVFASVACERVFHARMLGLAPGRARDQARLLAVALLLHARDIALRVALTDADADFEALTALAFGKPLAPALRGVWPETRPGHFAQLVALLTTLARLDTLRRREGDDWFRNPRAFATLRDAVQVPVDSELEPGTLTRRFEELLG